MTTSGTTTDSEWQRLIHRMATSGTTGDNEWPGVTTAENKLEQMTASGTTKRG